MNIFIKLKGFLCTLSFLDYSLLEIYNLSLNQISIIYILLQNHQFPLDCKIYCHIVKHNIVIEFF